MDIKNPPVSQFAASFHSYSKDEGTTPAAMVEFNLNQWNTFDLSVPSLTLDGNGQGWNATFHIRRYEDLAKMRDTLIEACDGWITRNG